MAGRTSRQDTAAWDDAGRAAFLRTVGLFATLPETTLHMVAARFHIRRTSRGEFIFLEGEPAETLNLLAQGRIKVIRETEDGREVILRLIYPGDIFGGAGGWGEAVYPASAVAQDEAVILQMPADAFTALLAAHPEFAVAVIHELGVRLRHAEARIRDLQTERVERRLARVLLRLADSAGTPTAAGIEIGTLSRQDLAELAGTTLSTASRTLSAWDQQGIIAAGRERVTILRVRTLTALAEDLPERGRE